MTPQKLHSKTPVAELIEAACLVREPSIVRGTFSPLFPDRSPYSRLADIDAKALGRLDAALHAQATRVLAEYREGLTASAGRMKRWLDASEEDIRQLALDFSKYQLPGFQKLTWARQLLNNNPIPGEDLGSQLMRLDDARFWRRTIRTIVLREREHFYLRLHLVGRSGELYVSDSQVVTRLAQLKRQRQWMEETVLVPRYLCPDDKCELLTVAAVATNRRTRFAKTYSFIKAMEALANEEGLVSAMVTLTALPEWHPNPSNGENSWNGSSPRHAHRHIAKGWHAIQVELYKLGIGISGLRVVEPHQDACPHWHIWLIYRPEVETDILATVMRQFPGKLKQRAPSYRGQEVNAEDVMFDTRDDVLAGNRRPLKHPKEGAQVEVSRIDPKISSGASYAMKYLLKTVDGGEPLNKEVDLFGDAGVTVADAYEALEAAKSRKAHQKTAQRVDAWRSLWGINASKLFGVARCLTAWDELRHLTSPPTNGALFRLWTLARGADKPGRVKKGAAQRGDVRGFVKALGGLAAARNPRDKSLRPPLRLARLTESGQNSYGEVIERPRGLQLIESKRVATEVPGKRPGRFRTRWQTVETVLGSVVTRGEHWTLAPLSRAAQTIARAQDAWVAQDNQHSPTTLGRRAIRRFWLAFHDACAELTEEVSDWCLPIPAPLSTA